jgi:hypothetical protein
MIHTFKVNLEIWVEFNSQHYVQESLFIPVIFKIILFIPLLFHENIIHSNNVIENANTIHNILAIDTSTIHYPYRRQFPIVF